MEMAPLQVGHCTESEHWVLNKYPFHYFQYLTSNIMHTNGIRYPVIKYTLYCKMMLMLVKINLT